MGLAVSRPYLKYFLSYSLYSADSRNFLLYIVIQHFFSQWTESESVLLTSCGPYIFYGVVYPFLEFLLLIVIPCNLFSPMILVILWLIVAIETTCFGSETQSLTMPDGAHLQIDYNQCSQLFLSGLAVCSHASLYISLIFFLSTTVKSAISSRTANADSGCSSQMPNTLANVGAAWVGGRRGVDGWMQSI